MGGSVGCTYGAGAIIGASRMVTSMNKFAAPESHLSNMISEAGSAVNEQVDKIVAKKMEKLETGFEQKLKNVKTFVFEEARKFV